MHLSPLCSPGALPFASSMTSGKISLRWPVQAASGLLAILVLLVVMNWFFTGSIGLAAFRLTTTGRERCSGRREERLAAAVTFGMPLLGFTSFYREGFEVVLFLQSNRFKPGDTLILCGVVLGVVGSGITAILTFVNRR